MNLGVLVPRNNDMGSVGLLTNFCYIYMYIILLKTSYKVHCEIYWYFLTLSNEWLLTLFTSFSSNLCSREIIVPISYSIRTAGFVDFFWFCRYKVFYWWAFT